MSVLVCGAFTTINNPTFDSLAAWNGTTLSKPYTASLYTYLGVPPVGVSGSGSLDPAFIKNIVRRANGDLYISIGCVSQPNTYQGIYRWNGTAWSTIFSSSTDAVLALDIHTASDTIYFLVGPSTGGAYIYKLAPASNTPVEIGKSDTMEARGSLAINQVSGDVYYGGMFYNMLDLSTGNPILTTQNIARYSSGVWYSLCDGDWMSGTQPYQPKKMVVSPSGYLYVIDGSGRLWFWMGSAWHIFTVGSGGILRAYGINFRAIHCGPSSDNPYVSYYDGSPQGGVYQLDITKFDVEGFQTQIGTIKPMLISTLAVHAGYLYAGGSSVVVTNQPVSRNNGYLNSYSPLGGSLGYGICKINLTTGDWQPLSSSDPSGVDGDVSALYVSGGSLYLGGEFSYSLTGATPVRSLAITDSSGNLLKKLGATGGTLGAETKAIIFKAEYTPNGDLYLLTNGTTVYDDVGVATSVPVLQGGINVACWNGTSWSFPITTIGTMGGEYLATMAVCPIRGTLYIGGNFSEVNGVPAQFIARWDGSVWKALGAGTYNIVENIKVEKNGVVFVDGQFGIPEIPSRGTARYERIEYTTGDYEVWVYLGSSQRAKVNSMSVDPISGTPYAVDSLNTASYLQADGFWYPLRNGSGYGAARCYDASFMHSDGITVHIAGWFTSVGSLATKCVCRWDRATGIFSDWGDPEYFLGAKITGGLEQGGNYYFTSAGVNMYSNPSIALMYRWDGTNFYSYSIALGETKWIAPAPDSEAPTPGGGGKIIISWQLASDNSTNVSELQYRVYQSTTPSLSTVHDIETSGIPITDWGTNISSVSVDKDTYQLHYFNVLVRDSSGNKSVYQQERAFQGGVGVATYYKVIKGDTGVTGIAGGIPSATVQSGNYTASSGDLVVCREGSSVTLPANPSVGDWVKLILSAVNNVTAISVTVHRNGSKINSASSDVTLNHTTGSYAEEFLAVYQDSTVGWCLSI